MSLPELVIFDCDGVLIDSEGISLRVLVDALAEHGATVSFDEARERYMGLSSSAILTDIDARYHIKFSREYAAKKNSRRMRLFEESLTILPGILHLIDVLPSKKCVASGSNPERLHHSLGVVGLWDRFAPHIFSSSQVKNGKPAPDLFLFAAEQMGVRPTHCLVIEDSIAGVRAAKAAHMRVYGFIGGEHCDAEHGHDLLDEGAESVFDHMDQITQSFGLPISMENEATRGH